MSAIIYLATNIINGKQYIGQTVRPLSERWSKHCCSSKNGSTFMLHNAIRKYGKENFTVEIIHKCDTHQELDSLERYYISKYDTLNNGYNMTEGGEDNPMRYENSRNKISEHRKQNYWCSGFGEENPMFKGYYVTPWGTAATIEELAIDTVHRTTLVKWCKQNNKKPFGKKAIAHSKYLHLLEESPIDKTPNDLGFDFIWKK